MIIKLNHKSDDVAAEIHSLFQAAYLVEAKTININPLDFPPLKRTINDILNSSTSFYGIRKKKVLIALIEVDTSNDSIHIDSLVIHPNHFRKGLGSQLVGFITQSTNQKHITVETAVKNKAATQHYQKLGFIKTKQWVVKEGLEMVHFSSEKSIH